MLDKTAGTMATRLNQQKILNTSSNKYPVRKR